MKHFYLQVLARSPLSIRADHAEGGVKTAHYIPGATLLGGLATAHRIVRPLQDIEFADFFLNEQVYFPHLYPAQFTMDAFRVSNEPVRPLPTTAQSCKRFSGFLLIPGEEEDEERHGIRDSLLDWAVFSLLDDQRSAIPALLSPLGGHDTCGYAQGKYREVPCGQAMDSINGYYRRDMFDPQLRMKAQVDTRLQTRTGINREWGVVEERILYNREVFGTQMRFWGEIALPEGIADAFKSFIVDASHEDVIRVGTGRTRGQGSVEIQLADAPQGNIAQFGSRLASFNEAVQNLAQEANVADLAPFYFAITLQSPAILCDAFLRYQKTLEPAPLSALLKPVTCKLRRIYQSVGLQRITGWNELWGTPRSPDYALEMGSTFLFACDRQLDDDLIQALYTLEQTGIGRRRLEGFGRISISDPFHLEREQA
jgi:CRISPR-associated protein Csx10